MSFEDLDIDFETGTLISGFFALVTGIAVWIYAAFSLGAIGLLFGWIPAIFFGAVAAAIAPWICFLVVAACVLALGALYLWLAWMFFSWVSSITH